MENDDTYPSYLNDSILVVLPQEMTLEILSHLDAETLRCCQKVCELWDYLISNFIWRKRAEAIFDYILPTEEDDVTNAYYSMSQMVFDRNLIKNHSGASSFQHWTTITGEQCKSWTIENPALQVPKFPNDPVFEGKKACFVSGNCLKYQDVNITQEGYSSKFLDILQPPIEVSVWFTGRVHRRGAASRYKVNMSICTEKLKIIDAVKYDSPLFEDLSKEWRKVSYVFKNYGPGVRIVRFSDGGHNKCKIAGTSIKVLVPETLPYNFKDAFI